MSHAPQVSSGSRLSPHSASGSDRVGREHPVRVPDRRTIATTSETNIREKLQFQSLSKKQRDELFSIPIPCRGPPASTVVSHSAESVRAENTLRGNLAPNPPTEKRDSSLPGLGGRRSLSRVREHLLDRASHCSEKFFQLRGFYDQTSFLQARPVLVAGGTRGCDDGDRHSSETR